MKILIIKPSSFGDIIQANPTLTALKKAYPQSNVSWLVFSQWADILALYPDLDTMIVWDKSKGIPEYLRVLKALRKSSFDVIIDLQGLFRTSLLTALSGAGKKIGVPGLKEFSWLFLKEAYPQSKSLNAVHRSLETVRFLTGSNQEAIFRLTVPQQKVDDAAVLLKSAGILPTEPLIGIIPSARGNAKQWPVGHYEALISLLSSHAKNARILLLGDTSGEVQRLVKGNVIDLGGKTTLTQLAAILQRCKLVIGSDTGPIHLSSALGIPAVVLFGGSDVRETAPIAKNATIIKKDFSCSPCRGRPTCDDYPCLKSITPQEVTAAALKWL